MAKASLLVDAKKPVIATGPRASLRSPAQAVADTAKPVRQRPAKKAALPIVGKFGPINVRRISEEICEQVRAQISHGALNPGDRLPSERELAEMFSVSRMAVREGMRNLEAAGIISMRKGKHGGAFIVDNGVQLVTQSLNDMLDFGRASMDMLMEVRLHVMDIVVRLACDRGSEADFLALERNIAETEALSMQGRFEERTFTAIAFNKLLAEATGNNIFRAIVESLSVVFRQSVAEAGIRVHDPVVKSRKALVALLRKRRKKEAAVAMRDYLLGLHEHMASARRERIQKDVRLPLIAVKASSAES
jgi:GntR family transcriptional repressor for pyruvate dehydrogenase complex